MPEKNRKWQDVYTGKLSRKFGAIIEWCFVIGASINTFGMLTHRPLSSANSKHNRLSACGAPLDRSSTEVILQRTLHLSCIEQLSQCRHHTTHSMLQLPTLWGNKITIGTLLELPKNYHTLLGAIKECRFN